MTRKDVIYNNLITRLLALTVENADFEPYLNGLDSNNQELLINLSDQISAITTEIEASRNIDIIHSEFSLLVQILEKFKQNFDTFPAHRINEILIILKLISAIVDELGDGDDPLLTTVIDENLFCFNEVNKKIFTKYFVHYDSLKLENSIFLGDIGDLMGLDELLGTTPKSMPTEMIYQLLSKIGNTTPLALSQYAMVTNSLDQKTNAIWAYVCLHIVRTGKLVHTPLEYTISPVVNSNLLISPIEKYQQFSDSIIILSEYNSQTDLLDKYLRLYHVVENFMYKMPLVELDKKHTGKVFSIRDFKRMNNKMEMSEFTAIKRLFEKIFALKYTPTTSFASHIFSEFKNLDPHILPKVNINTLFEQLQIVTNNGDDIKFNDVKLDNMFSVFAQLVYSYRNALVHNRETEFHLTHESLINHYLIGDSAKIFLEKFLLPSMENIIFQLIIQKNDLVWFSNSKLTLWNDN